MPYVIIFLFSTTGLLALFHPGLFTAHDIWHNVARLYHYHHAVLDGQFPPYWVSSMAEGFGYPLFFFSYHLPWLVGQPFLFAGLSVPVVTKILLFLPHLLSGFTFYLGAYPPPHTRPASLLGSLLYLWAPHRFLITLVSAATGVTWTFVFIPLYFAGLYLLLTSPSRLAKFLLSFGLGGLLLSHLPTALTLVIPSIILAIPNFKKIKNIIFHVLIALLISAFYLLPSLYYARLTLASAYKEGGFAAIYQTGFINFRQLVYSKWGYGPFKSTAKDGEVPYQLGFAQWAAVILLAASALYKPNKLKLTTLISFIICLFLMLDYSKPAWKILEKFISFDYPTRFLVPATFLSALSATLIYQKNVLFLLIIPLAIFANRNHLRVNEYTNIPLKTYIDSEQTTNSHNEYFPASASPALLDDPAPLLDPPLAYTDFFQNSRSLSFSVSSDSEPPVSLRQVAWPGQHLYLDGREIPAVSDQLGRLSLTLPAGTHTISTRFLPTALIKLSWILTLLGVILLGINIKSEVFESEHRKMPPNEVRSE